MSRRTARAMSRAGAWWSHPASRPAREATASGSRCVSFHVFLDGETTSGVAATLLGVEPLSPFEQGVVVGVLIGEGSFGGDGKQPQVTLRMHVRHEALFRWLLERFPR